MAVLNNIKTRISMFNVVEAKKKKNGSWDTRAKALNLKVMLGDHSPPPWYDCGHSIEK